MADAKKVVVKKVESVKAPVVEKKTEPKKLAEYSIDLRELLEAGCHFGHQARRWNPKMAPYIYVKRDNVHIFDLAKTAEKLIEAMNFVRDYVAQGNEIVFVGSKRQASAIVREEAMALNAPYVTIRWLGGTLTNWEEITHRINRLKDLKQKRASGLLASKYTKREQVLFDREISRLERFFGGLTELKGMPKALFIIDTHRERTAIKEANQLGIPVVALVDTNSDPTEVDYVIPVNDDAVRSIKLAVSKIAQAYADGKALRSA